ncbi:MAG: hypothetical protein AAGJ82_10770 [Bacteroidota bacterium]
MQNSKFIKYLSSLPATEWKVFRKFVYSPYFNTHQPTAQLLDYILAQADWTRADLSLEAAFEQVFPGEKFREQRIRTLLSNLVGLLKRFLRQQHYEEQHNLQHLHLLSRALAHNQVALFQETERKWQVDAATSPAADAYQLAAQYHQTVDSFNINFGKRGQGQELTTAVEQLEYYYLEERMRLACQLQARQQVFGHTYPQTDLQHWLGRLAAQPERYQQQPRPWAYYLTYRMLRGGQAADYQALKAVLPEVANYFQAVEGRGLYTHAINFCIGRINRGEVNFKTELFELYRQMLDSELLYHRGVLLQWDYTNIVALACDLEQHAWVDNFLQSERERLPENVRDNTYTYNKAVYSYSCKQYDLAISTLQLVVFTEQYYNLLARMLLLKIYYEKGDDWALDNLLDTFRIYLQRHRELGTARRKSGTRLIRYTRQLSKLRQSPLKKRIVDLRQQISADPQVLNKAWLLRSVDLLLDHSSGSDVGLRLET